MHELEHLHGEFDVAQTSPAEFDFAVFERVGNKIFDTFAHLLAVVDEVVSFGCGPDKWSGHAHIRLAEVRIAGYRACFEQGLEFPVFRPLLIIGFMGFEPAYQWAILAFGTQSAVDLPKRRFGDAHNDGLAYALQGGRHFGSDSAERHAIGVRVGGFHHVDQVHVGYIVELPCAQFAHADDGETYMFAAVHFMACDGECAFKRRVRKVGKFGADARLDFDGIVRRGVLCHDCGELFAIGFT